MLQKGFIDMLFILLCATIVLLSESIRIGTVEAKPAEVGGGAVSEISMNQVRLVIVQAEGLIFEEKPYAQFTELVKANRWLGDECAVLVPEAEDVTHHRMMKVWSDFQEAGYQVKFGAKAVSTDEDPKAKMKVASSDGQGQL